MSDLKQLSTFLKPAFANEVEETADQENRTTSNFIKNILKNHFENKEEKTSNE